MSGRTRVALLLLWVLPGAALAAACGAPPEPADRADARDAILESGRKLYSQHDEELVIRHFFDDAQDGFFVDVGSFHWKKLSTTYYLESHLGWRGIAIDAMPGLAGGYERFRHGTRFFQYIVTDRIRGPMTLHVAGGVSSVDPHHLDEFEGGEAVETHPVQVETITLDALLDRNGVEHIDFLSMDIEGHELEALAGFEIERFRPRLVCIEASPRNHAALLRYFRDHGYARIERYLANDSVNWYFAPVPD